jgi:hypothetical protein
MHVVEMVQWAGPVVFLFPLMLLASLAGTAALAVQGLRGREPMGWLGLAPMSALVVLVVLNVDIGNTLSLEAIAHASAETQQTLVAAGIGTALAGIVLGLGAMHLPGLALLTACAVVGARKPDGLGGAAAAMALVLVATACSIAGGLAADDTPLRALGVLVYGGLVVPSLLGGRPAHRLAGATAACAFPLLVAALEANAIAAGQTLAFEAVAHASMETKGVLMNAGLDLAGASRGWGFAAVGCSLAVAAIGCARAHRGGAALFALACVAPLPLLLDAEPLLRLMQVQFSGGF